MSSPGLLDRIERYFTLAPLADAQVHAVGPLRVPIGSPDWPYPARPEPGREAEVAVEDVRAAVALQERAGLPASLEWLGDRCRGLAGVARSAGLVVDELPLLVAADPVAVLLPAEVRLFLVGADDPRLGLYQRLIELAFASPAPRPVAPAVPVLVRKSMPSLVVPITAASRRRTWIDAALVPFQPGMRLAGAISLFQVSRIESPAWTRPSVLAAPLKDCTSQPRTGELSMRRFATTAELRILPVLSVSTARRS